MEFFWSWTIGHSFLENRARLIRRFPPHVLCGLHFSLSQIRSQRQWSCFFFFQRSFTFHYHQYLFTFLSICSWIRVSSCTLPWANVERRWNERNMIHRCCILVSNDKTTPVIIFLHSIYGGRKLRKRKKASARDAILAFFLSLSLSLPFIILGKHQDGVKLLLHS